MTDNLTEIKGRNGITITVGMDAKIGQLWGKIEKITSAWGGTIFVRFSPDSPLRKFRATGCERTTDEWHFTYASFHTPEQKCAIQTAEKIEKARRTKAYLIQTIKWEYAPADFISSVYNLAIENKLISPPPTNEIPIDKP